MLRVQQLILLALLALALAGSSSPPPRGSLRGALRALERRRRAPPGPAYPLASFQYPDRSLEYLSARGGYQPDEIPMNLDANDRDLAIRKAIMLGYFDKDDDYPSEDLGASYKGTAFRERSGQLKNHHKNIIEKKRSSPFRERGEKHSYQSDRIKDLFLSELAEEEEKQREESQLESDAEYVELLKELWDKYKYTHGENSMADSPENYIKIYNKDRNIRKRQIPGEYSPVGWGPIAFKKKRSSIQRLDDPDSPNDFLYSLKFVSQVDPSAVENLKDERVNDEEEDSDVSKIMYNKEQEPRYSPFEPLSPSAADIRDEYMLALQPLNNSPTNEELSEDESSYDYENAKEKRFPVSKRSGYSKSTFQNHRALDKRNLGSDKRKLFRSSGTDPRVLKELSSIFGVKDYDNKDDVKKTVKRSSDTDDDSHEVKPPTVAILSHPSSNSTVNLTHDHSHHEHDDDHTHEHEHEHNHDLPHSRHEHENKPPLLTGQEEDSDHSHEHEDHKEIIFKDDEKTHLTLDHPIILRKKSIDWSNYFGYDKRKKKSVNNDIDLNYLRNMYLRNAKKHMDEISFNSLLEEPLDNAINADDKDIENAFEAKRKPKQMDQIKLNNMDNKLKNMESVIVNEALKYSDEGLDTKEEQEIKEKILSRLAAAYSLEKMRKALKDFKMSLQAQRIAMKQQTQAEYEEDKEKKSSLEEDKKKKSSRNSNQDDSKSIGDNALSDKTDVDFESEQGAGHFLNGPIEPMSEGYMGGSGMKMRPLHNDGNEGGQCPVLDRIVRRCHNVDILAGNHGQLFLPLCSLHQICYLCGPSSPTGCDLIFLSEAESVCGGRAPCQQAARSGLMALREEHESLADDLEGECSRDSCLYQAIENHSGWQHPFKR